MPSSNLIAWLLMAYIALYDFAVIQGYIEIPNGIRRIADGLEASITEYPFMASIRYAGELICGGSIISPNAILTAAHCMKDKDFLDLLYVKVGDSDINFRGSFHQVAEVLKHEKYQELTGAQRMMNDIALLKLKEPIKIDNRTTRMIQLLEESDNARNYRSGTLIGWSFYPTIVNETVPNLNGDGTIVQEKRIFRSPANLRYVYLEIASDQECSELAPQDNLDIQFCAYNPGLLPCTDVSGSPLVVNGKQRGLLSWVFGNCSVPSNTAYFTDVAKYTKWIDEKMQTL
ncbi:hypothetical protein QAD02_011495 [Eretmocerus hayati]|uniref:Uncharacterized protein n=1 Tax=Eretmocerus hayati TaxID=131215 RepID=A0ACC2NZJ0_9HYME|nr:hypothetical protein QAD02_011495 [Eretmocerus hayati]